MRRYSSEQTHEEQDHSILIQRFSSLNDCHHQSLTHVVQKALEGHRSSDLQRRKWRNTSTQTKRLWSGDHSAIDPQMLADEAEEIESWYAKRKYLSAPVRGRPPVTLPLGQVANVINYRHRFPNVAATVFFVSISYLLKKLSRREFTYRWRGPELLPPTRVCMAFFVRFT